MSFKVFGAEELMIQIGLFAKLKMKISLLFIAEDTTNKNAQDR